MRTSSRHACLFLAATLALLLSLSPGSRAGLAPPVPAAAPIIEACSYILDPRTNVSYDCFAFTETPAFANVSIAFQVNVSDSTDNNMSIVFHFDYLIPNGTSPPDPNPDGPVRTVNVSSPGGGMPISVNATWAYSEPNLNFSRHQYYVYIEVSNDAGEQDPGFGTILFPVFVEYNSPPYMDNLNSVNSISDPIVPEDPAIPLVYENVSVGDPDNDPLTVTWDWGDGSKTVTRIGDLAAALPLNVTHRYPASALPLNISPRNVDIPVHAYVDDGMGHNVTYVSITEFYIAFDAPPRVEIRGPAVGSLWKVGEIVTMEGNATDPDGGNVTVFWDFDGAVDSTGTGDPNGNRDANGTVATHAYAVPGLYNITFWASDGEKQTCTNANCTNRTSHWVNASRPIEVRYNIPPVVVVSNATAIAGKPLSLVVRVMDRDGDNMSVRWDFGDGTPVVTNATGNSTRGSLTQYSLQQEHTYAHGGFYVYTIAVFDGNDTVNASETVFVQSFNLPPAILQIIVVQTNGTLQGNNTFRLNTTVRIRVQLYDPENDTLNISVDWRDGHVNRTTFNLKDAKNCTQDKFAHKLCLVPFEHEYLDIGGRELVNHSVRVVVTDGEVYLQVNVTGGPPISLNHTKEMSVILYVADPKFHGLGPWDWWDYSMLAVVIAIPAVLIGRFGWKVHRERQEG